MTPAYALYRRSRSHQDLSVEEQRDAITRWATEHGYRLIREFTDDASGLHTARRREFLSLLSLCADPRRREADIVLCYDVSRFSRLEPDEAAFHEYSLKQAGVRVIYTHEPGANDAGVTGQLVKSLKRVMAHDYSQKLSQVVARGLRAHAALGHWTGGWPPYGYRRAIRHADGTLEPIPDRRWKAKGEIVTLVPEPIAAAVILEIYQAYVLRSMGLSAIASDLNRRGVPPPRSHRLVGRVIWAKSTLWAILRNPIYKGTLVYAKARYSEVGKKRGKVRRPDAERVVVEGAVPAIVPPELWDAAQRKHGTSPFGVGRPWHRPYLLSGMITCGACGKRFRAKKQPKGTPPVYVCGAYLASGRAVCDGSGIPTWYLDQAVLDGLHKRIERLLDPAVLRDRLTARLRAERQAPEIVAALEAQLAETRRQIARLVDALAGGSEDVPSIRARVVALERDETRLASQLAEARAHADPEQTLHRAVAAMLEAFGAFRTTLERGEPEARKAVVRAFLEGIRIDKAQRRAMLYWYQLPIAAGAGYPLSAIPLSSTKSSCGVAGSGRRPVFSSARAPMRPLKVLPRMVRGRSPAVPQPDPVLLLCRSRHSCADDVPPPPGPPPAGNRAAHRLLRRVFRVKTRGCGPQKKFCPVGSGG